MILLVLAAGMGSRFGGLKQIEPVGPNGEFIIDYSIYDAINAGFDKVVFVIKKENYEVFKNTIGSRLEGKIKVEYAFQELSDIPEGINVPEERVKPLGTGHALYCARNNIDEPFAVISADDFYGSDAFRLLGESLSKTNEYSIIGYKIGNTLTENGSVKRGVIFAEGDNLTSIVESKVERINGVVKAEPLNGGEPYEISENHPVSMLMYGLREDIFDFIEDDIKKDLGAQDDLLTAEYYLPELLNRFMDYKGVPLKVLNTTAQWMGITYKSDLDMLKEHIKKEIERGVYPVDLG